MFYIIISGKRTSHIPILKLIINSTLPIKSCKAHDMSPIKDILSIIDIITNIIHYHQYEMSDLLLYLYYLMIIKLNIIAIAIYFYSIYKESIRVILFGVVLWGH